MRSLHTFRSESPFCAAGADAAADAAEADAGAVGNPFLAGDALLVDFNGFFSLVGAGTHVDVHEVSLAFALG